MRNFCSGIFGLPGPFSWIVLPDVLDLYIKVKEVVKPLSASEVVQQVTHSVAPELAFCEGIKLASGLTIIDITDKLLCHYCGRFNIGIFGNNVLIYVRIFVTTGSSVCILVWDEIMVILVVIL